MMRLVERPCLRDLTTLRLGGPAVALVSVEKRADLEDLPARLAAIGGRPASIGRGSNVLAGDEDLDLTLVRATNAAEPQIVDRREDRVTVSVPAGLALPRLLAWAARQGLSGLEGLCGVPGDVGGSAAMNAGSYGTELGGRITAVDVFTLEDGLRRLAGDELEPRYRELGLDGCGGWRLIWSVELALVPDTAAAVEARMAECLSRKRATQPLGASSAGCVFKNPEGLSAGRLLDQAGFKGRRVGGMSFSDKHANFLINDGRGTSAEALELIATARETVRERHGVSLDHEVKVWVSS